jgi:hypothetical protein
MSTFVKGLSAVNDDINKAAGAIRAVTGAAPGAATSAAPTTNQEEPTSEEQQNAIIKEYCKIIQENKGKITDTFNEKFQDFLDKTFEPPNSSLLSKMIGDTIISQLKENILDNFDVQKHMVSYLMMNNAKIQECINNGFRYSNDIFENIIIELDKAANLDLDVVGPQEVKLQLNGGGTRIKPTIIGGDTPSLTQIVSNKLMSWDNELKSGISDIIQKNIAKYLNNKKSNEIMQNYIVGPFQQKMKGTLDNQMSVLPDYLQIRMFHTILTVQPMMVSNTQFQIAFKSAIGKTYSLMEQRILAVNGLIDHLYRELNGLVNTQTPTKVAPSGYGAPYTTQNNGIPRTENQSVGKTLVISSTKQVGKEVGKEVAKKTLESGVVDNVSKYLPQVNNVSNVLPSTGTVTNVLGNGLNRGGNELLNLFFEGLKLIGGKKKGKSMKNKKIHRKTRKTKP